ncbi:hypothetical protein BH23ACT6_BH23ACT6_28010 [soil metagenome]
MPEVRVVGILRMKDRQAALDVLRRVNAVASGIRGAEVWEAFVDESDLVYLNQRFDSEDTYLSYENAVDQEGLRPLVRKSLEMERLLLLTPIHSTRLSADLDALGAIAVRPIAST